MARDMQCATRFITDTVSVLIITTAVVSIFWSQSDTGNVLQIQHQI